MTLFLLRPLLALGCAGLLAACGPAGDSRSFAAGLTVTPAAQPRSAPPAAATTRYDAGSGLLYLPGLQVVDGSSAVCFDAVLRTRAVLPVQLELDAASPRPCEGRSPAAGSFDGASGLLTLPALPLQRSDGTSCYDVLLRLTGSDPIRFELQDAADSACVSGPGTDAALGGLRASIVLGAPTGRSVELKVLAPDQAGSVSVAYGMAPGVYSHQGAPQALVAGQPLRLTLEGLLPNTRYHYRLLYRGSGGDGPTEAHSFHTARPPGSRFSFTVQADSHLDENADLDTYRRTLDNVRADGADFHIDLGDTFMTEKHSAPFTATVQAAPDPDTVNARYAYEHGNFGRFAHTVPLFLVNGNHDGELGWLANGSANSLPVWTTQARKRYFANPEPGAFYSGDALQELFVGERAAWYAWHWGDALFVVLDPYWNTRKTGNSDAWSFTLGERQYRWLADTLAGSPARYKFVFIHNLVGGLDGQMRGGIEAAPFYEWGGRHTDGSAGFATRRPGWAAPIHDLLLQHRVTAVFHGHDHLYARQQLDGIGYLEVPQPSAKNFASGANLARDYHYASGTLLSSSGHLRVTVGPEGVSTEYVRSWLPQNETALRRNGQVDDRWQVGAGDLTQAARAPAWSTKR